MSKTTTSNPEMTNDALWEQVLVEIELSASKATFNTWFTDTKILRREDGTVYVGVPNEFVRTWITEKYDKKILKLLRKFGDNVRNVSYEVAKVDSQTSTSQPKNAVGTQTDSKKTLPLDNPKESQKEDTSSDDNNLNPEYSFDSFVVGSFNELAHAASQAVIDDPGSAYNPLFVYGKTGFGKTHLIQAIGNHLRENSNTQAHYVTSEKFAVDYINSVQANNVNSFKEKYRQYDVLVMDDVHFLSQKKKTQEELFHLFNTMYDNNKQIVFSSDMHPNYLKDMEDRLKSRFNAGMIVDISPPQQESRIAILKQKAQEKGITVSEEIVNYIAKSIESNIRELEGAINAIAIHAEVSDGSLSLQKVKDLIRDNVNSQNTVRISDVVETVSNFYNIDADKVHDKTRKRKIVKPRQIIMYLLREDYNFAYPEIGEKIGDRDHTTVIHSYKKIKKELETDSDLTQDIHQIRALL
jgi:chromosomal replication initiator protein